MAYLGLQLNLKSSLGNLCHSPFILIRIQVPSFLSETHLHDPQSFPFHPVESALLAAPSLTD